jgi:hypothetical protein
MKSQDCAIVLDEIAVRECAGVADSRQPCDREILSESAGGAVAPEAIFRAQGHRQMFWPDARVELDLILHCIFLWAVMDSF